MGKVADQKWDAKMLQFEENILSEKELEEVIRNDDRPPSDKTLEGKEESEDLEES